MPTIITDIRKEYRPKPKNIPIAKTDHRTFIFEDRDLKGRKIESRAKDISSREVEGDARFCGHRFILKQHMFGDKRCLYCGDWFHWSDKDYLKWIESDNIDRLNLDDNVEPLHCGKLRCSDYHHLVKKYDSQNAVQQARTFEQKKQDAFKILAGKDWKMINQEAQKAARKR